MLGGLFGVSVEGAFATYAHYFKLFQLGRRSAYIWCTRLIMVIHLEGI